MNALQRILERLRSDGPIDTARWAAYQLEWRCREWSLGIETAAWLTHEELGGEPCCEAYEPIDFRCFETILDQVAPSPAGHVFLDYGCGKGRAVVLAALRPFARVIGIERSPELLPIARANLSAARRRFACAGVEIVEADARTWPVPDDVTQIFLFNSFSGSVLAAALDQIRASAVRAPREIALVYSYPVNQSDPLAEVEWLVTDGALDTAFWKHIRTVVYRCRPDAFDGANDGCASPTALNPPSRRPKAR